MANDKKKLKVCFLHPDLGIGGAERLILDVAIVLAGNDVDVSFVTNHFNERHAFDELKHGQFPIRVIGDWLPRAAFGRFRAFFAYLRMIYLSIVCLFFTSDAKPDVYFVDQIPIANLFVSLRGKKAIYYCHHPDLLASPHDGFWKNAYRAPIDWLESCGIGKSSVLLVNSEYTSAVCARTFPNAKIPRRVLYPTISLAHQALVRESTAKPIAALLPEINASDDSTTVFLSINRFHPAKNLELAIDAMDALKAKMSQAKWERTYLIVAGGYDPESDVNAKYFARLTDVVKAKDLARNVVFVKSPSDATKVDLLLACDCLIYTPTNEHFGIVPLEAMSAAKPVIACDSGGPRETVVDNVTGYLCPPTSESVTNAMYKVLIDRRAASEMGAKGRERMESTFSHRKFRAEVMDVLRRTVDGGEN